jgi:hypothetical protein
VRNNLAECYTGRKSNRGLTLCGKIGFIKRIRSESSDHNVAILSIHCISCVKTEGKYWILVAEPSFNLLQGAIKSHLIIQIVGLLRLLQRSCYSLENCFHNVSVNKAEIAWLFWEQTKIANGPFNFFFKMKLCDLN